MWYIGNTKMCHLGMSFMCPYTEKNYVFTSDGVRVVYVYGFKTSHLMYMKNNQLSYLENHLYSYSQSKKSELSLKNIAQLL